MSVALISPGAWNFANYLHKILECDYYPSNLCVRADVGILYGVFISQRDFLTPLKKCSRRIGVWVGTDVLQLQALAAAKPEAIELINAFFNVRLADAPNLKVELEALGVVVDGIVETPPRIVFESMPLPEIFTVGIYQPKHRPDFYNLDFCLDVAKAMPDVEFRLYGLNREFSQISDNVWDLGWINMEEEMPHLSASMRFVQHDGLGLGVIEYLMAGRRAITNQDIEMATKTEMKIENVVEQLRAWQKEKKSNKEASSYWRDRINHEKFKSAIEGWYSPSIYPDAGL